MSKCTYEHLCTALLPILCSRLAVGNEEGHNEFEDFPVGHVFYVGRLWGRVLCVDGGGGAGGEAGFGAAVGGAVVSTELVALPAAVAEGQREGRAVVDVVVAEFVAVGPAFDQSVVVFAEWAVCCVAVAAVVAQVLIWDSRSLLFLRAGLPGAPAGLSVGRFGARFPRIRLETGCFRAFSAQSPRLWAARPTCFTLRSALSAFFGPSGRPQHRPQAPALTRPASSATSARD